MPTPKPPTALVLPPKKSRDFSAYAQPVAALAIDALEAQVGGREKLVEALLAGPPDSSLDYVVGLLADPRQDARQLSTVCAIGKVTFGEVLEAYKRGILAGPQAVAIGKVAMAIPAVVEGILARAIGCDVPCATCNGVGQVFPAGKPDDPPTRCGACNGVGTRHREPDFDAQKLALDLGKLLPKSGPMVALQSNHFTPSASSASPAGYGSLMAAVDRILHPGRVSEDNEEVVDGTLAPDPAVAESPVDGTRATLDTVAPLDPHGPHE